MHYILVTELENTSFTSCKIQGLSAEDWTVLEAEFTNLNLTYIKQETFYEVDIPGIQVLNILAQIRYNYKIVSQSMAIEKTVIGGRTLQVQKLVWTLGKI
ncbi:unnamed protein product [Arctia plantaginis]|uniref:Uncharacterized protein n=1 Tax=Arctia plantaginis TaxID=874455 RepID=A0A8S1BKU2_ARCPL|nr:unnamed protein product [Arctia plantaginis]CAB3259760.1 unnamed protein product [Arctia plantaginis]